MEAYILKRRSAIAEYMATRPLYDISRESEPERGTPQHKWWREQEFDQDG